MRRILVISAALLLFVLVVVVGCAENLQPVNAGNQETQSCTLVQGLNRDEDGFSKFYVYRCFTHGHACYVNSAGGIDCEFD